MIETMAFCNLNEDYVNTNDPGKPFFRADFTGAALSAGALLIVALLILSDKKLGAHPNKIIAYVFLCDAYLFFEFLTRYVVCGYNWNSIITYIYAITA